MKTNKFISDLVKDLEPVKRITFGKKDYGVSLLIAILSILLAVLLFKPRSDLYETIASPVFVTETIILLAIALIANFFSFRLFIPGRESKRQFIITLTLVLAWILFLLTRLFFTASPSFGSGLSCIRDIVFVAIISVLALIYAGRKGVSLRRSLSGLIVLLTGASYGALSAQFICKNDDPLHVLTWHSCTLVLLTGFGIVLGKVFYRKI